MKSSNALVFGSGLKSANFEVKKESSLGKKKKRPSFVNSERLRMLLEAYYSRPYSLRKLAGMFGVSRMTVWRAVQQYELVGVKL